jgi:uncharacterized membrane protein
MNWIKVAFLAIIILGFLVAFVIYPYMPTIMDSHWNLQGQADGQMSRFWGVFLIPMLSAFVLSLFYLFLHIDPLKKNIEKFRKYFDLLIISFLIFLFYLYTCTLLWNLGYQFNIVTALMPAFAILWYACGTLMGKTEINWFIGIRTPWTLSDGRVWKRIHRLAGIMFKASAFLVLAGMFINSIAIFLVIIPPFISMIFLMIYSYFVYRQLNRPQQD